MHAHYTPLTSQSSLRFVEMAPPAFSSNQLMSCLSVDNTKASRTFLSWR